MGGSELSTQLSVVTVTWNNEKDIIACLRSVYDNTTDISLEYFIVDNGSTDDTVTLIKRHFPHIQLICNETDRGYAAANNQALRLVQGRYVLLLNPDTIIHGDAISQMLQYLESASSVGVVGPRLVKPDGALQHSCTRFTSIGAMFAGFLHRGGYLPDKMDVPSPVQGLSGAALMVRGSLLVTVGLLDEDFFMYGEDTDWCYRFHKAGWAVHYLPLAEILHLGGQSANQIPVLSYVRRRVGKLLFVEKHRARWQKWTLKYLLWLSIGLKLLVSSGNMRHYYREVLAQYSQVMNNHGKSMYPLQRPHRPG